ncbi:MAG: long-chain-fatty-acid--CoA ligase, partial [Deltaproteobacteria bacterium]|nr:long-chain-fatty-acid--CoA ligase [Deltaproteobacteria bacterium]
MGLSQVLRHAAVVNPNGVATQMDERCHTWLEMQDRVMRLAGAFRALGIERGDRIAMLALNSDRYYEHFFAVAWAGAVFVPINTRLAPPEIVYWLEDSGSTILMIDDHFAEMLPKFRDQVKSVREIIHVGEGSAPAGMQSYEELVRGHDALPDVGCTGDELAALFYTGGTTGRSKGVMLSHRNLCLNSLHMLSVMDWQREEVILHAAPMFHLADGAISFCGATLAASNCFIEAFEPSATLAAIEKYRASAALLVPTMINLLVNHPKIEEYDISSLRSLFYGASPMPEAVIRRAIEVMPDVRFYQGYGQTETSPVLTINGPGSHIFDGPMIGKLRAAGQPVPGVDVAILDESGAEVPRGQVGEICARGDTMMLGYWNNPEATAETLRDGWLHTGDGGKMDEDGYVYIVDRVKDMIISGGENVYSAEVENAIHLHPAVAECAVIGIPHEKWGEQVHAVVRLNEGATLSAEDLIQHCKAQIANYKCPRSV